MDPHRFDTLTKSLSTRRSRRTAVRALAGGLVAGMFGLTAWRTSAAADCTDRCARLPVGSAQDQCVAACSQVAQARATAEAEANQARADAEATAEALRNAPPGDFICGYHTPTCYKYVESAGAMIQVDVGNLREKHCYHITITGECTPCGGCAELTQACADEYPKLTDCGNGQCAGYYKPDTEAYEVCQPYYH